MRHRLLGVALAALAVNGTAATAGASFTQEPGSYTVGTAPYTVLTTDFTGDGRPDVLAVNGGVSASSVSLLRRQPAGGFTVEPGPVIGNGANYGAIADFDGNSIPDVGVSSFWGESISLLLGQPGGGFVHGLGSPIDMDHRASAFATADFDGDGDLDLAVGNWDSAELSIMRRDGSAYAKVALPETGVTPRYIAIGHFNEDTDPDLAVSNYNDGTVSILLGSTGVTFTNAPNSPTTVGTGPAGMVMADFDGDGRTDLAVVNYEGDSVSILTRQGSSFVEAPGSRITVSDGPVGIASGDFNSDRLPDLAVASNISSRVTVLLRNAGGGFTPDSSSPVQIDDNGGAYGVSVADFDADSRPDLAVSNDQAGKVTILLNTTPFPPPPPPPPPIDLDADDDGVQRPLDCDDGNPAVKPGAPDKPGDGIDQDCAGGDAPYPVLDRSISAFLATYQRYTKFTSLAVKKVRAGDTVRLTCRGRGCPLRRKTIRVTKDRKQLALIRRFKGAKLRRGAVVQLRVTRPETVGRFARWKMRSPKLPKRRDACLPPGATRPRPCPD